MLKSVAPWFHAAVLGGLWLSVGARARAEVEPLSVLVDADQNSATGCSVATRDGVFQGAELRLSLGADLQSQQVAGATLASCSGSAFGSERAISAPVSPATALTPGNGLEGADLLEAYLPLGALPSSSRVRLGLVTGSGSGGDALLNQSGQAIVVALAATSVPALSGWATLLGIALLGTLARALTIRGSPRRASVVVCFIAALLEDEPTARAVLGDGTLQSWGAQAAAASDPRGDSSSGIDVEALFARVNAAQGVLYLRIDAHARPSVAPSSGCGKPAAAGDALGSALDGRGSQRAYLAHVPAGYAGSTPLALVFAFHGAGGSEGDARAYGLEQPAGSNAILVYPRGVPWSNGAIGWESSCTGYDMIFFDNMLASLAASYCVDLNRVHAAGFSWGGDFVTALACCRGDKLRAVAPASCSDEFVDPTDPRTYRQAPCPATHAPSLRFTHAAASDSGYPAPLFATTSALFRAWAGCSNTTATLAPSCVSYAGCSTPYVECAYAGLGHALPSTWAADTWSFFATAP